MRKQQKGFSLIELLIVVAIILIIAAIAIPNLIRSRMSANEASAVGSIRTINTAEIAYSTTYPSVGFTALNALGGTAPCTSATSAGACLIDDVLSSGTTSVKSGYDFTVAGFSGNPTVVYATNAGPQAPGQTGQRYFYSDQSGVIRYNTTAAATASDAAL